MCLVSVIESFCMKLLTYRRLILYFPVSALVTLFGNILQNPQDPRARADVRLMNLVVSFLSMLGADEGNGGVKRMLGVCSEFERIAKVVLDKAEKESSSRRKRKSHEDPAKTKTPYPPNSAVPPQIPMTNAQNPAMAGVFSPSMGNQMNPQNGFSSPPVGGNGSPNSGIWQPDFSSGSEYMTPNANGMTPFADINGFTNGNEMNSPLNLNTFQQPFVPQDLWQMPMTLEWDWADMTGGQYPSFENGIMGDPTLQHSNNQHLQNQQMR
jgi:hypothetical protein